LAIATVNGMETWLRAAHYLHTARTNRGGIGMWKDPIVTETRSLREQYANQFGHNADAIFQDILLRQAASGKNLVSFQRRTPVLSQVDSQEERPTSNLHF
jgi:hypothetical protein